MVRTAWSRGLAPEASSLWVPVLPEKKRQYGYRRAIQYRFDLKGRDASFHPITPSPGGPEGRSPPPRQRPSPFPREVRRAAALRRASGRLPLPRGSLEGPLPLHVQSSPATCAAGAGRFFGRRACPPGEKSFPCAIHGRKLPKADFSGSRQGVAVAGESFSPVHMLRRQRSIYSSLFFAISIPVIGLRPVSGILPSSPAAPTDCGILSPFRISSI